MMPFMTIEEAHRYIEENERKVREIKAQQAYFNTVCYIKDCMLDTSDNARSLVKFYARACGTDYKVF